MTRPLSKSGYINIDNAKLYYEIDGTGIALGYDPCRCG